MDSTYIYSPLPSADSIRLFKLEPGDSGALLEDTLTTVSLSDPGLSFNALSYTRGNPLDEDSKFLNPTIVANIRSPAVESALKL
jgi:hypothetical protein